MRLGVDLKPTAKKKERKQRMSHKLHERQKIGSRSRTTEASNERGAAEITSKQKKLIPVEKGTMRRTHLATPVSLKAEHASSTKHLPVTVL